MIPAIHSAPTRPGPSRRRLTVRRLMLLVALAALLCLTLRAGPRPGLHVTIGGLEVGACRNLAEGRSALPDGRPGGWQHQLGVWRSSPSGELVAGVSLRDGRLVARVSGVNHILW